MRPETKVFLKELIDFYEASGRQRWTTIRHFWKVKKVCTPSNVRKWLKIYDREGMALLGRQTKPRKRPKGYLGPHSVETAKRVLELLKEDPNVSNVEGATILNISASNFWAHKKRFITPGLLTEEMKMQLGLIPRPEKEVKLETPAIPEGLPVAVKKEKCDPEDDDDNSHGSNDDWVGSDIEERKPSNRKPLRHCLLCYIRLEEKGTDEIVKPVPIRSSSRNYKDNPSVPIVTSSLTNDCGDDGELGENLNVIFALKNIFGLNSSDLVSVMTATNGRDPKEWYNLCESCDVILKEAIAIQHQVLQLSRELEKCKRKIKEKIKGSSCSPSSSSKVKRDNHDVVTKLIRESVFSSKKKAECLSSTTPLSSFDIDAFEVKKEPEDRQDEAHYDFGDFSNHDNLQDHENPPIASESSGGREGGDDSRSAEVETADLLNLPTKPKLVVCETCGEEMAHSKLPQHALQVHEIVMEGFTVYRCPKEGCKYANLSKVRYRTHVRTTHVPYNKRKYVCKICGKRFADGGKLTAHDKTHKNAHTRPYQCEICGSSFAVAATLYSHRKCVHEKNPKYTRRNKKPVVAPPQPKPSTSDEKTLTEDKGESTSLVTPTAATTSATVMDYPSSAEVLENFSLVTTNALPIPNF